MTRVLSQIRDSIRTFNVRTVLIHQIQLSLVEPFYNDDDDGYGYGCGRYGYDGYDDEESSS